MDAFSAFKWGNILNGILTLILGILFVASPFGASESMVLFLGALLIVAGIVNIVQFIISRGEAAHSSASLIGGILMIGVGIFAFTHMGLGILLTVLSLMVSVFVLVCGVTGLDYSMKMRRAGTSGWVLNLILSIIILIGGIFMLIDPFDAIETTFLFVGMMMIMDGIFEIIMSFSIKDLSN